MTRWTNRRGRLSRNAEWDSLPVLGGAERRSRANAWRVLLPAVVLAWGGLALIIYMLVC